jgi:hypothetical protein
MIASSVACGVTKLEAPAISAKPAGADEFVAEDLCRVADHKLRIANDSVGLKTGECPLSHQPSGTRLAASRGASEGAATASGSSPQTSICAASGA